MFDALDRISPETKKTAGRLAVGAGIALFAYNQFERPRASLLVPLALVGSGAAIMMMTSSATSHHVSGPQEDADRAAWKSEEKSARMLPWIVGAAALATGALIYARSYA